MAARAWFACLVGSSWYGLVYNQWLSTTLLFAATCCAVCREIANPLPEHARRSVRQHGGTATSTCNARTTPAPPR